jgi:hypothetical protein
MSREPFIEKEHEPAYEKHAGGEKKEPFERLFKAVTTAFKSGTDQAKQKAKESAPDLKSAVEKAAYALSYGLAYGGSFGLTMVKELVPVVLMEGGSEGIKAGQQAARRAMTPRPKKTSATDTIVDVEYTVS